MSTLWSRFRHRPRTGDRQVLVGNVVALAGERSGDALLVDEVLVRLLGEERCRMKGGDSLNLSIEVQVVEADGRLAVRVSGRPTPATFNDGADVLAEDKPQPSYTCPRCGRTSYNPEDVRAGYCAACHDWT